MAKKKKKKKKPAGARKATYAKGKKVEPQSAGKGAARKGEAPARQTGGKSASAGGKQDSGGVAPWNVVRRGTREMKVFQVLVGILIIGALLQYPLWNEVAAKQYKTEIKKYEQKLEQFNEKYKTDAERKKNEKEKPIKPLKPSFGAFLIYQALLLVLQGAFFAFLGLNVASRTDMGTPILDKLVERQAQWSDLTDLLLWSIPFGLLSVIPLVVSTIIGKTMGLSKVTGGSHEALWKNSLNYMNVALFNEMMFVFLLISSLVWVFTRYRDKVKLEPHWAALVGATLLAFGYFYLANRSAGEKLGMSLTGGAFLAVSLVGILGYLYWKKGLEYSLLAGVVSLGLYPFIASFFIK